MNHERVMLALAGVVVVLDIKDQFPTKSRGPDAPIVGSDCDGVLKNHWSLRFSNFKELAGMYTGAGNLISA